MTTKAEQIEKYGQAWYDAVQQRAREKRLANAEAERERVRIATAERRARLRQDPVAWAEYCAARETTRKKWLASSAQARLKKAQHHKKWRSKPENWARHLADVQAYREKNREKVNGWLSAGNAKRRGAGKPDIQYFIFLRQQPCADCGSTSRVEIGHLIPVSRGGSNDNQNLIPQCASCNRRLHNKPHLRAMMAPPQLALYMQGAAA